MHNVTFILGDPSGDGHASTSEYHMLSNYSSKEIDDAYEKATEILGFNYVKEIGNEWEDSEIREPFFSILIEHGIITRKEFEYEGNGTIELDTYIDEEKYIDIFKKIIRLVLPNFKLEPRNLNEQMIYCLYGAAYGVAYHGE